MSHTLYRSFKSITAHSARVIATAALAEAEKNGWHVAIHIIDVRGSLLQVECTDDVRPTAQNMAAMKAKTALMDERSTRKSMEKAADRPFTIEKFPGYMLVPGGFAIVYEDQIVGAIGVAGAKAEQDEQVARAGVQALTMASVG